MTFLSVTRMILWITSACRLTSACCLAAVAITPAVTPASIKAYILPKMLKIYPQLKDVRIDYEWGGKIGIVLNRIPALGRINKNVYYSQGYSGHGVNATHTMGEIVADAVTGTMEKIRPVRRHAALPDSGFAMDGKPDNLPWACCTTK